MRKTLVVRFLIALALGIVAAGVISEFAFWLLGNTTSRAPRVVEIVIPKGAAQKVAQGEIVIAVKQVFVVGDTLLVHNEDTVMHTLGPLFIPSGSSASLKLSEPENLSYACSFQPTKIYDLDVREPLTASLRIEATLIAGIPMGFLLALYSLVLWPLKPKGKPSS